MACFIVPGAEGLAVLGIAKIVSAYSSRHAAGGKTPGIVHELYDLTGYLLGGAFLLAIEHIWHGEIIFSYPFLTAMKSTEDMKVMFHEMATTGVAMSILVTAVWGIGLWYKALKRNQNKTGGTQLCLH